MRLHRIVASAALVGGCSFQLTPLAGDAPPGDADAALDARPAPACFGALCRRTMLTVDHTRVSSGPHEGFPVLVDLTDPELAANAAASGFDLTFTAADGTTKLPHERELFAGGRLVAWVTVPRVTAAADTVFYLYFGDRNATVDGQAPAAVWGSEYQGVWHVEETTGGTRKLEDSTTRAHHGTDEGGLTLAAAGKIGRAIQHDGVDDRLRVGTTPELEQATATATLSLWVNFTAVQAGTYQRILMSANAILGDGTGFEWGSQPPGLQDVHYYYPSRAASSNLCSIALPFVSGQWHYLALTQDFTAKAVVIYVDGLPRTPVVDNIAAQWTTRPNPSDWYWGGAPPRNAFAGRLDEIRVATTARSAGWIATEFANQSAPGTFVLVGPTVVGP